MTNVQGAAALGVFVLGPSTGPFNFPFLLFNPPLLMDPMKLTLVAWVSGHLAFWLAWGGYLDVESEVCGLKKP